MRPFGSTVKSHERAKEDDRSEEIGRAKQYAEGGCICKQAANLQAATVRVDTLEEHGSPEAGR